METVSFVSDPGFKLSEDDNVKLDEEIVCVEDEDEIPLGYPIDFNLAIPYERQNKMQDDGNPGLMVSTLIIDHAFPSLLSCPRERELSLPDLL